MRITSNMYYSSFISDNNKVSSQKFDVNQQISSGLSIQYAQDDVGTFVSTMRLDNEITVLNQVKESSESAYKFSSQTDTTLGDIVETLESLKVNLVNAASGTQSDTSLEAIAKEMEGLYSTLLSLANTSIGGQYLFSGTATSTKSVDDDGNYLGNDGTLLASIGSGIQQAYNISGADLFFGEESSVSRKITTNVQQLSLSDLYPDIMGTEGDLSEETYITGDSTIRDLMGDTDSDTTNDTYQAYFYVQGTTSEGESFKTKIAVDMDSTVDDLMSKISDAYGEDQVDVSLNDKGQIVITDKKSGSSKLDFHMVAAVDFSGSGNADVTDTDALQSGTVDFEDIIDGTNSLYVKEFTLSGLDAADSANVLEGVNYDQTMFEQDGAELISNVSQISNVDNSYAVGSTKLIDVAGVDTLDGQQLSIVGTDINGASFTVDITLSSSGSTFSVNGGTAYSIFDASSTRSAVDADEMTYQQLMDVVNMAMSGTLPASNTAADYDAAITTSNTLSSTTLNSKGQIVFEDKTSTSTQAQLSIFDSDSSDFSTTEGSALVFNANNALTVQDPKTDFFSEIEQMILAVQEGKIEADGSDDSDPRNVGIQNAIQMIDDLIDHVTRLQTQSGSYSQTLSAASDRADLLIVSSETLRSEVLDTDQASAALKLEQLTTNYEALMLTISKASQLSLVNYL